MSTKEDTIYVGVVNILSMEKIGNVSDGQPLSKSKCIRVYIDSKGNDTVEGFKESEVDVILDGLTHRRRSK